MPAFSPMLTGKRVGFSKAPCRSRGKARLPRVSGAGCPERMAAGRAGGTKGGEGVNRERGGGGGGFGRRGGTGCARLPGLHVAQGRRRPTPTQKTPSLL